MGEKRGYTIQYRSSLQMENLLYFHLAVNSDSEPNLRIDTSPVNPWNTPYLCGVSWSFFVQHRQPLLYRDRDGVLFSFYVSSRHPDLSQRLLLLRSMKLLCRTLRQHHLFQREVWSLHLRQKIWSIRWWTVPCTKNSGGKHSKLKESPLFAWKCFEAQLPAPGTVLKVHPILN